MKSTTVIVSVVLAGTSVLWSQAAGQVAEANDAAKSQADTFSGFGRHARDMAWVVERFDAARKARTKQRTDEILAEITARIETALRQSPDGTEIGDRLGRCVLNAWLGRIKGCHSVRLHAWRLAVGQGDQGDRKAVLAATGDVLKSLKTQVNQLEDIKFEFQRDMRVWIVIATDFHLTGDILRDACARACFYRGLALAAGKERTQAFDEAIGACWRHEPAALRRAAVLAARCHLALDRYDKALAALKPFLAAGVRADASTVRAAVLAGKCAWAVGNIDKARAYLARARAGLDAISQPSLRALVDAEITIWAQSMATVKVDPAARGAELVAFAKRNGSHGDVLPALLGISGQWGGVLLGPALADTASGGPSPVFSFYGTYTPGDDVVYVVDRSGSMVTVFDYVRLNVQLSVGSLRANQRFHIILFADEKTIEGPGRGLVSAAPKNKISTVEFFEKDEVRPRGRTTALVALKRAFQVLDADAKVKRRRVMNLLTDGEFAGIGRGASYKGMTGNQAVVAWLKANNADGRVVVNTYLYTHGTSDRAVKVMKQIATEHSGEFKAIGPDE